MASLPISNNSQPPGNIVTGLQANSIMDGSAGDAQSAESFALLLAQQISDACLSALNTGQTTFATDTETADIGLNLPLKDQHDQVAILPDTMENQPDILASILQQLPAPENSKLKVEENHTTPRLVIEPLQKEGNMQTLRHFTGNLAQKTDSSPVAAPLADGISQKTEPGKSAIAVSENHPLISTGTADRDSLKSFKTVDLPSGTHQPFQNTVQAIVSSSAPVATPNLAGSNIVSGNNIAPDHNQPSINTPLGGNGWAEEFSQKISWVSTQQNQIAALHLNPPNLGPLDVVLKISDNQATALFTSPHGAVRDAVENALPKLREILADNGIMLGNTTISDHAPRERGMDEFANPGFGTAAGQQDADIASEQDSSPSGVAQATPARRHNGMVDTFA